MNDILLLIKIYFFLLMFIGCSTPDLYKTNPTLVTPLGIRVDPGQQVVDLAALDRQVNEYEACIRRIDNKPAFVVPRDKIVVKTPNDWVYSCDKTQQLLNVKAPDSGCLYKGLTPTEECPCRWRVRVYNKVILVTPSLYMLKDGLHQVIFGSTPWFGKYAECATPSVPKLPKGVK